VALAVFGPFGLAMLVYYSPWGVTGCRNCRRARALEHARDAARRLAAGRDRRVPLAPDLCKNEFVRAAMREVLDRLSRVQQSHPHDQDPLQRALVLRELLDPREPVQPLPALLLARTHSCIDQSQGDAPVSAGSQSAGSVTGVPRARARPAVAATSHAPTGVVDEHREPERTDTASATSTELGTYVSTAAASRS